MALRDWWARGRRNPLLAFTGLTALALPLCVRWADRPLAEALHAHGAGLRPFFGAVTGAADRAYEVAMHNVGPVPVLLGALALGYLGGRWLLRWQEANVLLLVLLVHVSSTLAANLLKVAVHRQRPDFTAGGLDAGGAFGSVGGAWDSFPSAHTALYWGLLWPLAVAWPRWRGPLLLLPGLVALGRLVLEAHYLSDVWAAIWLVLALTAGWRRLVRVGR